MSKDKKVKDIIGDDYLPGMTVVDGKPVRLVTTLAGTREVGAWKEPFLAAFAISGNVTRSCAAAGITVSAIKWSRDHDEEFIKRYDEAFETAADRLEQEMNDRIYDPSGNRGSDPLLMFALKAVRPTKYRELVPQHGGRVQATAVKVTLKLGDVTPESATIEVASQEVASTTLSEGEE